MRDHQAAVALVGAMVTVGCGRFGFSNADGGIPSGDDGQSCTATASTVSEGSTRASAPKLFWNGTKVGVSWLEDPSPATAHFRTVSLDGATDPIANLGVAGEPVQVAWDGTSWRLAWSTNATKPEIMLSTDGAAPRALTSNPRSDAGPRMALLPGGKIAYLWRTDASTSNVRLTVLDAAGNKLVDDLGIATGTFESAAHSLVWTGSELVAFYPMTPSVMMLRMTPNGLPVAAATAVVTLPASQNLHTTVASWTGDRFLIAYVSGSGTITSVYITYVSPSGTTLVPGVFVASGGALVLLTPSIAVGPTSDALTWDAGFGQPSSLVEVFRDGTLGKLYTFEGTSDPSVAWVGTTWAVALSQAQPATATMPIAKPDYVKLIRFCP